MKVYAVVLRRSNGRYVKQLDGPDNSKYRMKSAAQWWGRQYDHTYTITVEPLTNPRNN
jgi:hypothetical protein